MGYYVYMLKSIGKKSITYVGYTNNLKKRLDLHNSGKGAKGIQGGGARNPALGINGMGAAVNKKFWKKPRPDAPSKRRPGCPVCYHLGLPNAHLCPGLSSCKQMSILRQKSGNLCVADTYISDYT